jgi:hypothetical protein
MASKKASSKGKRYSAKQKQEVIDFVTSHNEKHGRGGATAASKKFSVSPLTVGNWLKSAGQAPVAGSPGSKANSKGRGGVLAELSKLDAVITAKRKELDSLEARFQKLKDGL